MAKTDATTRLVGDEGLWAFICADIILFALLFLTFAFYRAEQTELFAASQAGLCQSIGMINTLILLTSSWFVAKAVVAARSFGQRAIRAMLAGAIICGLTFVGIKAIEYGIEIGSGAGLSTNQYFMFYFVITGLHLVHVLIGISALCFTFSRIPRICRERRGVSLVESAAAYWHMVDLLWIIIFPLLYLVA